jgi:hypothetical protein
MGTYRRLGRRDVLKAGGAAMLGARLHASAASPTPPLASPVGQYEPEVLMLAPESGDDLNMRSLVAQFLELGVALELDANWRLPTSPPRDLSAYKACIFPESVRSRYDADLDAFYRRGGYLGYFKYYPLSGTEQAGGIHHYFTTYGRDAYFFHVANVLLEAGLTPGNPEFARALEARAVGPMVPESRELFFGRFGKRDLRRWESWGDTAYTQLIASTTLAAAAGDREWADLVRYCLGKVQEAVAEALTGTVSETRALAESPSIGLPMLGELLMAQGEREGKEAMSRSGFDLVRYFVERAGEVQGALSSRYMRLLWSETLMPVPSFYWAARVSGDRKYASLADKLVRTVTEKNQRPDGLWHHWSNGRGGKGACWSRGCGWPVLAMTRALDAVEPGGASAAFMRAAVTRTFQGLARHQDRRGIWHLVVDEPETRLESSAAALLIYGSDRLRQSGGGSAKPDPGVERAFTGLKRLYYRGGLAASCRGTATGTADYYRTRPLGYYDLGLFPAALASRRGSSG